MRVQAFAGVLYPSEEDKLRKAVSDLLGARKPQKVVGAVVPHASLSLSGKTAAALFSRMQRADTFVIIGANRSGIGEDIALSREDWQTPLGTLRNDVEFGKVLMKNCPLVKVDEMAHMYEHSIEVQLPFLQVMFGEATSIVPIAISSRLASLDNCEILGAAIKASVALAERAKKSVCVIAAANLTHLAPPFPEAAQKDPEGFARSNDRAIVDAIVSFDAKKTFELSSSLTQNGYGPLATLIYSVEGRAKKASVVAQSSSSDVVKGESIVGYASILFE